MRVLNLHEEAKRIEARKRELGQVRVTPALPPRATSCCARSRTRRAGRAGRRRSPAAAEAGLSPQTATRSLQGRDVGGAMSESEELEVVSRVRRGYTRSPMGAIRGRNETPRGLAVGQQREGRDHGICAQP